MPAQIPAIIPTFHLPALSGATRTASFRRQFQWIRRFFRQCLLPSFCSAAVWAVLPQPAAVFRQSTTIYNRLPLRPPAGLHRRGPQPSPQPSAPCTAAARQAVQSDPWRKTLHTISQGMRMLRTRQPMSRQQTPRFPLFRTRIPSGLTLHRLSLRRS